MSKIKLRMYFPWGKGLGTLGFRLTTNFYFDIFWNPYFGMFVLWGDTKYWFKLPFFTLLKKQWPYGEWRKKFPRIERGI